MFDLILYEEKTVQFTNMLFGDHSRTFDLHRLDLFRALNMINNCSGENINMYVTSAKQIIHDIKDYIHDIKDHDIFSFYTNDSEMFISIEKYFNEIENSLIS